MKKPEAVLKKTFGFKKFRPYQKEIITHILEGRDVFALFTATDAYLSEKEIKALPYHAGLLSKHS
ncbi:MAG: hypothetical protein JXR86_13535 [Spirochaetales bacterium]|nr:hypothetical protein [Spirochaetales bacterium]